MGACLGELLGFEKFIAFLFGGLSLLEKLGVSFAVATGFLALADLDKLHFEDESGVRRDRVAGAALTVGVFGCELELGLLTDGHGGYTHVPALDDLALSNCELEGLLMI